MFTPFSAESMPCRIRHTKIRDVKIVEPHIVNDARGLFFESFDQEWFEENVARGYNFVQDQHMVFSHNVLTGLHYQLQQPRGLLLRVVSGDVFAVAVDVRRWSVTFGRWVGERVSSANNWQMWIPPGFAYGFHVRSDVAEILVKATSNRNATFERTVCWNDPEINIAWGMKSEPLVTAASANGVAFPAIEVY
ncbi:dTDP-4-dehydrorhamnose 3,5-epimerase [Paraburkholderia sprentiae]|nr:dTDP-4-dehydrorhamnose 3,5-epimerase [Paraburkholderia sprentiae]